MIIGIVGLGKMGAGMAGRLHDAGIDLIGFDANPDSRAAAAARGIAVADGLRDLVERLGSHAVVWMMLPAGRITQSVVEELATLVPQGTVVVDGGNSDFRDAARHERTLAEVGAEFVDVGVSGGQWGWKNGYGLMVGATEATYERLGPVLDALSADGGQARVGGCGSGHLVKALHNGVQYAVMQAYAEGFALLEAHPEVDSISAMQAWQGGSSVRSWLLGQMVETLETNPTLEGVSTEVPDSGMGRWTSEESIRLAVPTPVLTAALFSRFRSRGDAKAERLVRASRTLIGGQQ